MMLRYDLLGAVKYPKKALKAVEPATAIAVLDRVFDTRIKPHDELYLKILRSKKNLSLVVHANWAGSSHNYNDAHFKRAKMLAKRLTAIVEQVPGAEGRVYLSPYLESRAGTLFLNKTFTELKQIAPKLQLVNSIISGGSIMPDVINEIHNEDFIHKPKLPYIWSFDGYDHREHSFKKYLTLHTKAQMFGVWQPKYNGRLTLADKTPVTQRKHWPTLQEIKEAAIKYNQGKGS